MEQNKFYQIKNITEDKYTLVGCDGSVTTRPIQEVDKSASAFHIQDAKDGDVLCTYECGKPKIVFILKGAPKKPYVLGYYCFYNIMYPHFEFDSEKGCLAPNEEDVKPATKEQRDTLFAKMHEACYMWDVEKKELKKIEQNTAWSEEDEQNLNEALSYIKDDALKEFIKSLRPQTRWRPSDEQMHYLSWIANVKLGDSVVEQEVSKHLNELYEDLLKLKS